MGYFAFLFIQQRVVEITDEMAEMSEEITDPRFIQILSKLAELKILSCLKPWLIA
jgi:hypothetical protein